MTEEWIPVAWVRPKDYERNKLRRITIKRMNSTHYPGDRYSVKNGDLCLNTDGKWEREPFPSNRDKAFYERCRFKSFNEAAVCLAFTEKFENDEKSAKIHRRKRHG